MFSVKSYRVNCICVLLAFACVTWINIILLGSWCTQSSTDTHLTDENSLGSRLAHEETHLRHISSLLRKRYGKEVDSILFTENLPVIYIVTPTYSRAEQKAELTVLAQTFLVVPRIHWIVVEDAAKTTALVEQLLLSSGLSYTHLVVQTPPDYKLAETDIKNKRWSKPRGVQQRNKAVQWLREHLEQHPHPAVLYFADDDNTYDIRLFDEMRYTRRLSVWPVGLVGKLLYESPLVKNGRVTSWRTAFKRGRPFALDMAGFAVNAQLLLEHRKAAFSQTALMGMQESIFLMSLGLNMKDAEPKASNCTKILVWHTRTEKPNLANEQKLAEVGLQSDTAIEV